MATSEVAPPPPVPTSSSFRGVSFLGGTGEQRSSKVGWNDCKSPARKLTKVEREEEN
jgi:hypothetical protein